MDKEKELERIRKRQEKNPQEPAVPPICPFMSDSKKQVSCNEDCKLFRETRRGYECYFQELQSISWNTRRRGQPQQ